MTLKRTMKVFAAMCSLAAAQFALAGAHTWRVNEVFSSADGTIQFIELRECCGGTAEHFINGAYVRSNFTGNQYTFTANLSGNTANRHILLATAAFAALPGAPTPDHIIPENFFEPTGDTVSYYVYDPWAVTNVPTDCLNSRNRATNGNAVNSPTNYQHQTGSVNCGPPPPQCEGDINNDQAVGVPDLLSVIGNWGPCGNCGACPADLNSDCSVGVPDLLNVIGHWGPCS